MKHFATKNYWQRFSSLSKPIQKLAQKSFNQLKDDPRYPSLHLKKINIELWSVRIGSSHRALGLAYPKKNGIQWFWIGTHEEYNKLINN